MIPLTRRAILAAALPAPALAQGAAWPDRPIKVIIPFPPGGPMDMVARMLEQLLPSRLRRQPIVVENRSGGGGAIAMDAAARAAPDGYTVIITTPGPGSVLQTLVPGIAYDSPRDFAGVTNMFESPSTLWVRTESPLRSFADVLDAARRQPGRLNFATTGIGGTPHLAAELLQMRAGVRFTHVPYRGAGPAQTAILAGEVDFAFLDLSGMLAAYRGGTLRGLAMAASERHPAAPEIPTVAELGVPGVEVASWYMVLVPAATPRDRIAALHRAIDDILQLPENRERFTGMGFRMKATTPEATDAFLRAEVTKWAEVIRVANIRPE
ncbi:Bug family tripartite tricarboxylate transporter substrate binding protein [Falsiroseomonas sp. HW251]|uniref:Bug family tripartite tricarboxylate transporter substrate binding protein n=1 Tax=Falsiroseomonas sp. HW251 TaxID=3390998 RepID=UPI003D30F9D8